MSAHRPIALALCIIAALAGSRPAHAAFDAVLCLKNTGSGTPKFRIGKPPAPAACKSTEIQIAHFDGTTFLFTGINVQIVSGAGATDASPNGKGNLIIGYNAANHGQTRTGSHNLVVGDEHEYTSYGGFVAGHHNAVSGHFASVSGGESNTASGPYASVSGGESNTASGVFASISGGDVLTQPATGGWAAGSYEPNTVVGNFESP
jgi:hypothetical protein